MAWAANVRSKVGRVTAILAMVAGLTASHPIAQTKTPMTAASKGTAIPVEAFMRGRSSTVAYPASSTGRGQNESA